MKKLVLTALVIVFCASCSVAPEPIHYGEDNCVHCAMTIIDRRYGTEIVTKKGKVYKFDSVECLVEFLKEDKVSHEDLKLVMVTPFNHPGELADATTSQFLHCKGLPSPMGKYLTAFNDKVEALQFREENGGVLFCWEDLLEEYNHLR